jgi:hypothetical protein
MNFQNGVLTIAVQKDDFVSYQGILLLLKAPASGCLIEMKKAFLGANDLHLWEIKGDQLVKSNAPAAWSPAYFLLEGFQPFEEWRKMNNVESFLGRPCVATTNPLPPPFGGWKFEVK